MELKLTRYHIYTALFILLTLISCKKKDSTMGTDVQPADDVLNAEYSDTATIYTYSKKHEATRSYQDQFKYLGSNQDPVFGRTDASIFTNFSIPNNVSNIDFGNDAVLDSAEVRLTFTQSFVGDTTTLLTYKIHQVTTALDKNASYYLNDTTVHYNASTLCNTQKGLSFTDGFHTVRLPLDPNFAASILNNPQYLVNNSVLQSTYKGLYITTSSSNLNPGTNEGALMKMDLDNPVSGIYLYYHNNSAAVKVPKTFRFSFSGDNAARFSKVNYNYLSGASNLLVSTLNGDTTKGDQTVFLKGLGGIKTVFRVPHLKNYSSNSAISVSRAEVVFKVDQSFAASTNYEPSIQLALVAIDEDSKEIYVKDQYLAGSTDLIRYGGTYDEVKKEYVFNIARHVQDILNGKLDNFGFYLVVANPDKFYVARRDDNAARVILGGYNSSLYAPDFRLTFVRFPNDK